MEKRSVDMLEADPQIILARHKGQPRREPTGSPAPPCGPICSGIAPPRISAPSATSCNVVFYLASAADRDRDLSGGEEFAQARDDDLAQQDDQRGDDVESLDVGRRSALRLAISITSTAATMILSAIGSRNWPSREICPCARAR